jgi:uncharacterized protein DUF397
MALSDADLSRAVWRKSTRSNNGGACVEVARNLPGVVAVRDSKEPDAASLIVSRAAWTAFLCELKSQHPGS